MALSKGPRSLASTQYPYKTLVFEVLKTATQPGVSMWNVNAKMNLYEYSAISRKASQLRSMR